MKKFLALILAAVMLLTAIPAMAANEAAGELTIWVRGGTTGADTLNGIWGNEPGDPFYDYLKEQFPNIKFNFVLNKGWREIPAAVAAGDAPDIFFWEGNGATLLKEMTAMGLVESLTPYMTNDADFVNNFVPGLIASHSIDGQVYALPFDVMPQGIFVNYDLLDRVNVDYPSLEWTVEEFTEMCKAVTNKSDLSQPTIAIARNIDEEDYHRFLTMFLAAYGATTYGVREDGTKYSNLSEDPAAIAAVEAYMELRGNNYAYTLSKDERNVAGLDNSVWNIDWVAGVAATFPGVASWAYATDANGDPLFTQVFYPAFKGENGQSGAIMDTISYSIYAGSENKDLAWEFLSALTSEEFRTNAYTTHYATGETVYPFAYNEDRTTFNFGIPPFTTQYELNEDFANLYNGLAAAMNNPFTPYLDQVKILEATKKIASGEKQVVDALKEYDEYVNANNLIVY